MKLNYSPMSHHTGAWSFTLSDQTIVMIATERVKAALHKASVHDPMFHVRKKLNKAGIRNTKQDGRSKIGMSGKVGSMPKQGGVIWESTVYTEIGSGPYMSPDLCVLQGVRISRGNSLENRNTMVAGTAWIKIDASRESEPKVTRSMLILQVPPSVQVQPQGTSIEHFNFVGFVLTRLIRLLHWRYNSR